MLLVIILICLIIVVGIEFVFIVLENGEFVMCCLLFIRVSVLFLLRECRFGEFSLVLVLLLLLLIRVEFVVIVGSLVRILFKLGVLKCLIFFVFIEIIGVGVESFVCLICELVILIFLIDFLLIGVFWVKIG